MLILKKHFYFHLMKIAIFLTIKAWRAAVHVNYIYSLLFIFFASFWLRRKPCTGSRYLFPENNVFLPFLYSLPPSPETLPCLLTCLCPHTIPFPAALGGNAYFISSTTHCEYIQLTNNFQSPCKMRSYLIDFFRPWS